jgi:glycerophosphoryl diester phosphodiesterase
MKKPDITAHTGCMGTPDNTIASSLAGIEAGAGLIEVDVQTSQDGIAFLFHDELPIFVISTYSELNQPDLRRRLSSIYENRELATLEQLFEETMDSDIRYNLDLKTEEAAEPTIDVMERMGMSHRVFFTGSTQKMTQYRERIVWNTPTEWVASDWMSYRDSAMRLCDWLAQEGYYGLNMHYHTCCPELVEYAHKKELAVWVYTVDDPMIQTSMIEMGVDAITTRQVDELRMLLEA